MEGGIGICVCTCMSEDTCGGGDMISDVNNDISDLESGIPEFDPSLLFVGLLPFSVTSRSGS